MYLFCSKYSIVREKISRSETGLDSFAAAERWEKMLVPGRWDFGCVSEPRCLDVDLPVYVEQLALDRVLIGTCRALFRGWMDGRERMAWAGV
jgi:hypothetical protein